ncbi:MAG: HNH endonuclease [Gemmataceae bacterium]|nr:HNH endonuclease [Gemmataceae bacterium]
MNESVRNAVRRRARSRCEYCLLPELHALLAPFQVEHIIARQHEGPSTLSNLALACHRCNLHKGPNLTGIDPRSRRLVPLFHPRRMKWSRHFRWQGPILIGRTAIGRATIHVLNMNEQVRADLRQSLIAEGVFPPAS